MKFVFHFSAALLLVSIPAVAGPYQPDTRASDLSKLIAEQTQLPLQIAYDAIVEHDKAATNRMISYAHRRGPKPVLDTYLKRLSKLQHQCATRPMLPSQCEEEGKAILSEMKRIRDLSEATPEKGRLRESLLFAAIVYQQHLNDDVLGHRMDELKRACGNPAGGACAPNFEKVLLAGDAASSLLELAQSTPGRSPASTSSTGDGSTVDLREKLRQTLQRL